MIGYRKSLNSETPKWFKEWYAFEFVPMKVKQDILLVIGCGIAIGLIAKFLLIG